MTIFRHLQALTMENRGGEDSLRGCPVLRWVTGKKWGARGVGRALPGVPPSVLRITQAGVVTLVCDGSPGSDEGLRGGKGTIQVHSPSGWSGQYAAQHCGWMTRPGRRLGLPPWKLPRQGQDGGLRLLKPKPPAPTKLYFIYMDVLNILPGSILLVTYPCQQ